MPKSTQGEQLEKDEVRGVTCFPLCAREEDALPPLHSPHPFCLCLCVEIWKIGGMGGDQSKKTPLGGMLNNFKRGFNEDCMVKLTAGKLRTSCEIDCPAFGVGWFLEGSLHKVIVNRVF
jgi:hypothetical protein